MAQLGCPGGVLDGAGIGHPRVVFDGASVGGMRCLRQVTGIAGSIALQRGSMLEKVVIYKSTGPSNTTAQAEIR